MSGLLFTEHISVQKKVHKIETRVLNRLKKEGILINNIYDLVSIGNRIDVFIKVFYKFLYEKELKRKNGKKYLECKDITSTIIKNAKENESTS